MCEHDACQRERARVLAEIRHELGDESYGEWLRGMRNMLMSARVTDELGKARATRILGELDSADRRSRAFEMTSPPTRDLGPLEITLTIELFGTRQTAGSPFGMGPIADPSLN